MAESKVFDEKTHQESAGEGTDLNTELQSEIVSGEAPEEGYYDEIDYELASIERDSRHRKFRRGVATSLLLLMGMLVLWVIWLALSGKLPETEPTVADLGEMAQDKDEAICSNDELARSNDVVIEAVNQSLEELEDECSLFGRAEDDFDGFSVYSMTTYLADIYAGLTDDPAFTTDGEFLAECQREYPGAIYPSTKWTPDEVIKSYESSPEIWVDYYNKWWHENHTICWTPDYRYCFELEFDTTSNGQKLNTGWLRVNGVRVKLLDQHTYDSVTPPEMVERYQSGEWNGNRIRSTDGGTAVLMDKHGMLYYRGDFDYYNEYNDPKDLGYDDYVMPWWTDEAEFEKYAVLDHHDWSDEERFWEFFDLKIYPDLPVGYDVDNILLSVASSARGTLVMTSDGAMLFKKGELLKTWIFDRKIAEESYPDEERMYNTTIRTCDLRFCNDKAEDADVGYVYDGRRVLALEPNGEIRMVVDETIDEDNLFHSFDWSDFLGVKDGNLVHGDFEDGENEIQVLATEVFNIDLQDMKTFERADGLYAITQDEDYNDIVMYLGTESKEYYIDYFMKLYRATY